MTADRTPEGGNVHIYTGDGKGKTTAALGLSMRARGWGAQVLFVQFLKGQQTGEWPMLDQLGIDRLAIAPCTTFVWHMTPTEKDALAHQAQQEWHNMLAMAPAYDILVLDEIMGALACGLLPEEWVCMLLDNRPAGQEVILTGRQPPAAIIQRADLITEMQPLRHYYQQGVPARKGIEY